jgi:hypothetical protein
VCLCGKRAGIEEEKRREDLWLRLQVDRLLAKGNCRYLARSFPYHRVSKNVRYDLHIGMLEIAEKSWARK